MRAFAAVLAREIAERRIVFLVGLTCGLLGLVAAAFHGWNAPGNAEVRLLAGSVGGLTLGAALAFLYGASVIAGETAEKRISFYFSRPIPAAATWAGKLLAATFTSFTTGLLVFLPGWLSGGAAQRLWGSDLTPGLSMVIGLSVVVTCVLAAHACVTVARLRSPWVALDLLLAPALVLLAAIFLRSLVRDFGGFEDDGRLAPLVLGLAGALLAALLLATFVQVAEGRTDARRAHGAFSVVFFGILGAAVALLGGFAWWCASARATDLAEVDRGIETAPRGPWVAAGGRLTAARGGGKFLFDAASGRSIRVHGYGEVFSADGARAAWGEPHLGFFERKKNRSDVSVADLATGRAEGTGLECADWCRIALSPSGRRLALVDGTSVSAYDVSTPGNPKEIAALRASGDVSGLAFVDEDTLRLFPRFFNAANRRGLAQPDFAIAEFSLLSKKLLVTGRLERESLPYLRASADGRFMVGTRRLSDDARGPQTLTLHEGRTGVVLATLAAELRNPQTRFLSENRLVVLGIADAKARAFLFEGNKGWGSPARVVELGAAMRVALGGEIAPGRVALTLFPFEENLPASQRAAKLVAVDAATGAVSPLGDGLVPANRMSWWLDPVLTPAEAAAPWSTLFLDADGRLVRLDPTTGASTVLLGKGK